MAVQELRDAGARGELDVTGDAPIGILLSHAIRLWYRRFEARMTELGYGDLRSAHAIVYENIGPNGSRQSELAERGFVTKQAVAQVVAYLEERGYVERITDTSDRRAALVTLTAKGRKAARAARGVMTELEAEWAELIGDRSLKDAKVALGRLIAAQGPAQPE